MHVVRAYRTAGVCRDHASSKEGITLFNLANLYWSRRVVLIADS